MIFDSESLFVPKTEIGVFTLQFWDFAVALPYEPEDQIAGWRCECLMNSAHLFVALFLGFMYDLEHPFTDLPFLT